jgi:rubredoxin
MNKEFIITVSYITEIDESILAEEDQWEELLDKPLDKRFPRTMKISNDIRAKWEQTSIQLLDTKYNCTKCNACGSWVTDKSKPDYIAGLSAGEYVKGNIYCPECANFAIGSS